MPYDCKMYSIIQFFLLQESFNKLFYILKWEQIKEGNGVLRNVVREFNPLSFIFFYFLLPAAPTISTLGTGN